MIVEYVFCDHCGYEDFDIYVAYIRKTASSDWWYCPNCNAEISNVDTGEEI